MTKVLFLTHSSGPIPHLVHLSNVERDVALRLMKQNKSRQGPFSV